MTKDVDRNRTGNLAPGLFQRDFKPPIGRSGEVEVLISAGNSLEPSIGGFRVTVGVHVALS